ncbi:MAG: uncharacterized protein QOH67_3058 [Hyphomicrobiales bacterium]|jgi:uncharacterized DUF497 family protein|nr:uncharacterized protein [Hyphomicrobiales bacterium]
MERTFAFDSGKRAVLIARRGIDLSVVSAVFDDRQRIDYADTRFDYGEERRVTIGKVDGDFFTVVYTLRGDVTWLITAWPSSRKERARYG